MLHRHVCASCEQPLVCACSDRRQIDRSSGLERKILCLDCAPQAEDHGRFAQLLEDADRILRKEVA